MTQANPPPTNPERFIGSLGAIQDEAGLLQWAKDALRSRNSLDEPSRAVLDREFLTRVELLGADLHQIAAAETVLSDRHPISSHDNGESHAG